MPYSLTAGWVLLAANLRAPPEPLAPSLSPDQLSAVAMLPATSTLVIGGAGSLLPEEAWAEELRTGLDARVARLTGLDGVAAVETFIGGCTEVGCAVLASGEGLDTLSLAQARQLSAQAEVYADRLEVVGESGARYRLQRLEARQQAAFGHAEAVARLLGDDARLDPAALADQIPDGDVWLYARDQEAMAAQLATWARTQPAQRDQIAQLRALLAQRPDAARHITGVALSLEAAAAAPAARLRLTCDSPAAARATALLLRAQVARQRLRASLWSGRTDLPTREVLRQLRIVRHGHQVEATFTPTPSLLKRLLR